MNASIKASPARLPTIPPISLGVMVVGPELGLVPPPPLALLVGAAGPLRPPLPLPLPPTLPSPPSPPPPPWPAPPRTPPDVVDGVKELDVEAVEGRNDEFGMMVREVRLVDTDDVEREDDGDDVMEDTVEFVVEVAKRTPDLA